MDRHLQALVAFDETHDAFLRRARARAEAELGFSIAVPVFTARLYAVIERILGEVAPKDRRVKQLLATLQTTDLYLAAAVIAGVPEAVELLRRWYGPFLAELGGQTGRTDLEEELIGAAGSPSPLAHYLGLSSIKRWLAACAARAAAPPAPRPSLIAEQAPDPDLRRAFDLGPARALAALEPLTRLGINLHLVASLSLPRAAALLGVGRRQLSSELAAAIAASEKEIDRELNRQVPAGSRPPWGGAKRAALVASLLRDAAIRGLATPASGPCPDANLLVGALDRVPGISRRALLGHAALCWPCLNLAVRLGPKSAPRPTGAWTAAAALAAAAVLLALLWRGSPGNRPLPPIASAQVLEEDKAGAAPAPATDSTASALPAPSSHPVLAEGPAPPPVRPPPGPSLTTHPLASATPGDGDGAPTPPGRRTPPPAPSPVPSTTPAPAPSVPAPATPVPSPVASPGGTAAALGFRIAPGDSQAARIVNLAVSRYREGMEDRTLQLTRRALEIDSRLREGHFNCAVLYERIGDRKQARYHWARFLQLATSSEEAAMARERLHR